MDIRIIAKESGWKVIARPTEARMNICIPKISIGEIKKAVDNGNYEELELHMFYNKVFWPMSMSFKVHNKCLVAKSKYAKGNDIITNVDRSPSLDFIVKYSPNFKRLRPEEFVDFLYELCVLMDCDMIREDLTNGFRNNHIEILGRIYSQVNHLLIERELDEI